MISSKKFYFNCIVYNILDLIFLKKMKLYNVFNNYTRESWIAANILTFVSFTFLKFNTLF